MTDARNWLFSFTTLGRGEMGSLVTVKLQISGEKTHCGVSQWSQCPSGPGVPSGQVSAVPRPALVTTLMELCGALLG